MEYDNPKLLKVRALCMRNFMTLALAHNRTVKDYYIFSYYLHAMR